MLLLLLGFGNAHAEWIQVALKDNKSNFYVVSIKDSSTYEAWPLQATIGDAQLEINRSVAGSNVSVCARYRQTTSQSWKNTCHQVTSSSSSSTAFDAGFLLAMASSNAGTDTPALDGSNSAVTVLGAQASTGECPEGTVEHCYTAVMRICETVVLFEPNLNQWVELEYCDDVETTFCECEDTEIDTGYLGECPQQDLPDDCPDEDLDIVNM